MPKTLFACLLLLLSSCTAHAEVLLTSRSSRLTAGGPVQLELTIINTGQDILSMEVPSPLRVRLETADATSTLEFMPQPAGRIAVAPNEFVRVRLEGTLPSQAQGTITLTPAGFQTNALLVQIDNVASSQRLLAQSGSKNQVEESDDENLMVDKPPPLALSVYEPVYFIFGGDGGLNSKFQVSFRYRLFDDNGRLASKAPWLDDLYLSFSQTALWDLNELSKPFKDSSYRPRLFYANNDLLRLFDGRLRLGLEGGAGHESNGKDGEGSRSYNMLYVRPVFTGGDPEGLRFYLAPLLHNYVADDENPDLADYRGYVDWSFGVGSKGGLDFWATLRKGERRDFGSIELNLSYPLAKINRDLTGWMLLQYFGGYGESLLDYRQKLQSQFRLGIGIAL